MSIKGMSKEEVKKPKIYLASPFFDEEQVDRVSRVEQGLIDNPFVEQVFSPRMHQIEGLAFGSDEWRKATYNNDVKHLHWCDVVVAVNDFEDDFVDSGTAFEIGYATAIGKPVVLIHEKVTDLNLMISDSIHAYLRNAESVADYNFLTMPESRYKGDVI